jgi:ribonuclease HI
MSSSPADALDAHAHLLPVHLLIDKILHRAALRFATLPPTHLLYEAVKNAALRHVKRHPTPLHYLLNNYPGLKPHLVETIAATRMKPTWTPNLAIRVANTKEKAKEEDEADRARVKVYSDGSGLEGAIGASAVLYRDGELKAWKRFRLGSDKHHTVYEGEGIGMLLGVDLLREEGEDISGMVPLGVDSQAAIAATGKIKPAPSHYIWDAFHRHLRGANKAHPDMDLLVRWTPGHTDIEGNEMADFHAKSAILDGSSDTLPKFLRKRLPKSKSALRQARNAKLQEVATAGWRRSPRYARLANIDPALPSPSYLRLVANLPRKHAAVLFHLRTRHAPLAEHLFRLNKTETPACPSCNMFDETVDHFLMFCPAHEGARRAMLHEGGRDTTHINRLLSQPTLLPHLFRFIARSGRLRAVYGDLPDLPDPGPAK